MSARGCGAFSVWLQGSLALYLRLLRFFGCDSTIVQRFGLPSSLLLFAALGWVVTNSFLYSFINVANLDFSFSLGRFAASEKVVSFPSLSTSAKIGYNFGKLVL